VSNKAEVLPGGGDKMLIIDGFIENGVFIPNQPIPTYERMKASLEIREGSKTQEALRARRERIKTWKEFGEAILNCDEELTGEPEPIKFRTLEELEAL
jgi:predicted DNA-binding antitoxin AbrB/MazE fold protein